MENYKRHIIIVDDDKDFADSLSDILEDDGYKTIVFYDAYDVIDFVKENQVHFIISDVKLSKDIDGVELLRRIKKIRPNIYGILITAYAELDSAIKAIRYNAFSYLKKPLNDEEILLTVRNMIGLFDKEREIEKYRKTLEKMVEERTAEIRKINKTLELITSNVPVGIWQINENGQVVFFNEKFSEITGMKCCELPTKDWKEVFMYDDLDKNKFEESFQKAFNKKSGEIEGRIKDNEGHIKWVSVKYSPVYDEDDYVGTVGVLTDITKKKIVISELQRIKQERV